jgi:phage terminase small subunit
MREKQKRFVAEYLVYLDGAKAAIRAGYSEKSAYSMASRLLRNVGSAQEFVETRILGRFLKNDEFGLGDCHALGLEQ